MANSLGPLPTRREMAKLTGGCFKLGGGLALLLPLAWLGLYLLVSPSGRKTVIGEVSIPNGHKLSIGRAHDGDISFEYYARVEGAGDAKLEDWTRVGWSSAPCNDSVTAVSSDSRFAAVEFNCDNGKVIIIYDSNDKELWWNARNQPAPAGKFAGAWRMLHSNNPRLSAPP